MNISNLNVLFAIKNFKPDTYTFSTAQNEWVKPSFFKRFFYHIQSFFNKEAQWLRAAQNIDHYCRNILENSDIVESATYSSVKEACQKILNQLKIYTNSKKRSMPQAEYFLLKRQELALGYRQNFSIDTASVSQIDHYFKPLETKISERLKDQKHSWCLDFHSKLKNTRGIQNKPWFENKYKQVFEELKKFDGLVELINEDSKLLEDFIIWSFRDNCPVEIFAAFPEITDRLKVTYAAERLGRASEFRNEGHYLQVSKVAGKCFVTLPIVEDNGEIKQEPILSRKKFSLGSGFETTLPDFAKALVDRYDDVIPPFQCTQKGIIRFDTHKVAKTSANLKNNTVHLDPLKLESFEDFWNELPCYETITKEEANIRCEGLEGENPGFVMHSSMQSPDIALAGSHGYFEVLLPTKDGNYNCYSFGKTADNPKGSFELIDFLRKTVAGRLCCVVDQNEEFAIRQNWGIGFSLKKENTAKLKEMIFDSVKTGRDDKLLPFSLAAKNCHGMVASFMKKILSAEKPEEAEEIKNKVNNLTRMSIEKIDFFKSKLGYLFTRVYIYLFGSVSFMGKPQSDRHVNEQLKSYSLRKSRFFEKKHAYAPDQARFSLRNLEQEQLEKLKIAVQRNRVYIANGHKFLDKLVAQA